MHRKFVVHEDLLCATSKLFQQRLQKHRKLIGGECSICHEEMSSIRADITFCRSECGQNFHEHCLEQWKSSGPDMTCPMCRREWTKESMTTLEVPSQDDIEPEVLQTYVDWLYTGTIHMNPAIVPESDDANVFLLKALALAYSLDDSVFRSTVKAHLTTAFESKVNTGFRSASIEFVCHPEIPDRLRHYVLVYLCLRPSIGQILNQMEQVSDHVKDVVSKHMEMTFRSWFNMTTNKEYEIVDTED